VEFLSAQWDFMAVIANSDQEPRRELNCFSFWSACDSFAALVFLLYFLHQAAESTAKAKKQSGEGIARTPKGKTGGPVPLPFCPNRRSQPLVSLLRHPIEILSQDQLALWMRGNKRTANGL
jgi:hypothetical protein